MSWMPIKSHNKQRPERTGVEIGVMQQGCNSGPRMRIAFGRDVLEEMGIAVGDQVMVVRGDLKDEGMLALYRCEKPDGWRVRHTGPMGKTPVIESVALSEIVAPGVVAHEVVPVKHSMGEITLLDGTTVNALLICLPGWVHGNAAKARK